MALRRPPTRIELKTDDIEEYEEILSERRQAANGNKQIRSSGKGTSHVSLTKQKPSVADRIGLNRK